MVIQAAWLMGISQRAEGAARGRWPPVRKPLREQQLMGIGPRAEGAA
jgi:hypothetical protein